MEELPESINRILARLEGDDAEGLLAYSYSEGVEPVEERHRVSVFGIRPGAQLWQLNDAGPENLWDFIETYPGVIIRFSETCHAAFLFEDQIPIYSTLAMNMWLGDGVDRVAVGPLSQTSHFISGIAVLHRFFSPTTSLPLVDRALTRFRCSLEDALRFQTGLQPQPDSEMMDRIFRLNGDMQDESGLQAEDTYSIDCWRECFRPDLWNNRRRARVHITSLPLSDQQWMILGRLSIDQFNLIQMTIPWVFLENTEASSVWLQNSQSNRPGEPTRPVKTALQVSLSHDDDMSMLDSPEKVDGLLMTWLSRSWSIGFYSFDITEAMWTYLWTSPALMNERNCTHLAFTGCSIDGRSLYPADHAVIPRTSWVIKKFTPFAGGAIHVCRVLPALSTEEMTFFRPETNPLLDETPPFDVRQSVLLEALLRHRNDPARTQQLLLTYSRTLLQPRASRALATDLETSVVELRALAIDQQAMIDLLLEVNHAQQSDMMNVQHSFERQRENMRDTIDELESRVEDLERRGVP